MAVNRRFQNEDIDYGSASDVRMNNGTPTTTTTTTKKPSTQYCPEGQTLLGMYDGIPKCSEPRKKYRGDKQLAYEKAIAQGIRWTGQYTKDEVTGEVAPKPIEVLIEEKKNEIVADINDATSGNDNLLKKYWWVLGLAVVGYIVLGTKD